MTMLRSLASRLSPGFRAAVRDWLPPTVVRGIRRLRGLPVGEPMVAASHAEPAQAVHLVHIEPAPAPPPAVSSPAAEREDDAAEAITVIEVDDADFLVGELFRRRFNTSSFPNYPRHFVALARTGSGELLPLGYVHHTIWNDCALCGGLVIDNRLYRRLRPATREAVRREGGVAELLLRRSFALLPDDLVAIWGYVGDKQAEQVDLRVGFRHTGARYVMVIWRREDLSEAEKADWIRRVVELGAF